MSASIGPIGVSFFIADTGIRPFKYQCNVTKPFSWNQRFKDLLFDETTNTKEVTDALANRKLRELVPLEVNALSYTRICEEIGFFAEGTVQLLIDSDRQLLTSKLKDLMVKILGGTLELNVAVPTVLSAGLVKGKLEGRILKNDDQIDRILLAFNFGNWMQDAPILSHLRLGEKHWVNLLASEQMQSGEIPTDIANQKMQRLVAEKVEELKNPKPATPVQVQPAVPAAQPSVVKVVKNATPVAKQTQTQPKQKSIWEAAWKDLGKLSFRQKLFYFFVVIPYRFCFRR